MNMRKALEQKLAKARQEVTRLEALVKNIVALEEEILGEMTGKAVPLTTTTSATRTSVSLTPKKERLSRKNIFLKIIDNLPLNEAQALSVSQVSKKIGVHPRITGNCLTYMRAFEWHGFHQKTVTLTHAPGVGYAYWKDPSLKLQGKMSYMNIKKQHPQN